MFLKEYSDDDDESVKVWGSGARVHSGTQRQVYMYDKSSRDIP